MVCINGYVISDFESGVHNLEYYKRMSGRRIGGTPDTVARSMDYLCNSLVQSLTRGMVKEYYGGGERSSGMDDGSGALARIELARKAIKGDEQAKGKLIDGMRLNESLSHVHPDWIERLATNTKLETRATTILEAKREREKKERERREQQNK